MNKILVINDSESVSEIIQYYLEMNHYSVYTAFNGLEGFEKAKNIIPDLILLDVVMPGIDGFETCLLLKKEPSTQDIPVLFLSSLSDTTDKIKGLDCGGVDFINNSVDQQELLARIETHLKIKELTKKLQDSNQELRLKQKALNEDLYAAANIQLSLLPPPNLSLPKNIEVTWSCQPSELIGGDICNISPICDNTHLSCYVLDVSGHGVPSAMVTVSVTQYLREIQLLTPPLSPSQVVSELNREYPFEKFNMFSTIFYMILNAQNGKLMYSNAGHPAGVYLSPGKKCQLLESTGPMIGVDSLSSFSEQEITLMPGDRVFLYSDGITEYRNDKGEFYGSERFYALLEKYPSHPLNEMTELIYRSLKEFGNGESPRDDISILGIEFKKNS